MTHPPFANSSPKAPKSQNARSPKTKLRLHVASGGPGRDERATDTTGRAYCKRLQLLCPYNAPHATGTSAATTSNELAFIHLPVPYGKGIPPDSRNVIWGLAMVGIGFVPLNSCRGLVLKVARYRY